MCLSTTAQTGSSKEPSNEIHKRLPYISHSACLDKLERTQDGQITVEWEGVKLSNKFCAERYTQYTSAGTVWIQNQEDQWAAPRNFRGELSVFTLCRIALPRKSHRIVPFFTDKNGCRGPISVKVERRRWVLCHILVQCEHPFGPSRKWIGWFSNRTGTSVEDGARKSNNWLHQWQSSKLGTGSQVLSFRPFSRRQMTFPFRC